MSDRRGFTNVELDELLESPSVMVDPYPIYRRLRDEAPVMWSDRWNSWVLSRYEHVQISLRDRENLSNERRHEVLFSAMPEEEQAQVVRLRHYFGQKDVIASDPPDHTRMRSVVQKAFTPRMVADLEPRIRDLVREQLEIAVAEASSWDLVAKIAHPVPVMVIAEMLGAPREDRALFRRWSSDILSFQGSGRTELSRVLIAQSSLLEMFDYMNGLIEERAREPKDDLITALASAESDGRGLSRDELLSTCNTLLTAGHETTTNLIGNLAHLLLEHRDQWERLRVQPDLMPRAIEEALRFDAPKQRNFRRVLKTHDFAGATLRRNEMVFQLIGSANRDPEQFSNPDAFDIETERSTHLAFGSGIHFCLGAALARLEAKVAIEAMLALMPNLALVEDGLQWQARVQFRGPAELWLQSSGDGRA